MTSETKLPEFPKELHTKILRLYCGHNEVTEVMEMICAYARAAVEQAKEAPPSAVAELVEAADILTTLCDAGEYDLAHVRRLAADRLRAAVEQASEGDAGEPTIEQIEWAAAIMAKARRMPIPTHQENAP